jgi:rubrerythrin
MTDSETSSGDTDRFEKTERREIHSCSECDEFELEKKFSGVAGTPGEEEYDRIEAPDKCPVCGGEIEREVEA